MGRAGVVRYSGSAKKRHAYPIIALVRSSIFNFIEIISILLSLTVGSLSSTSHIG